MPVPVLAISRGASTISGHTTARSLAGIYSQGPPLIEESTLSDNHSGYRGGALY